MPGDRSLLDETLEAWSGVRTGLIDEVRNIPADRFDYRPAEEVRSVAELVQHIIEVALMMTGELTRSDGDFTRAPFPELIEEHAADVRTVESKDGLVELLRTSFEASESRFREVGELFMLQYIRRFDGELGTRLAWLHHGIEQEMYHRGQITLYERLLGIEPALTRRIRGG